MKKVVIAIAALLISASAYAQGIINFRTHIGSATPPIDFKILNSDGSVAVGAFAQLVVVGAGNALTPMTEAPGVVNTSGYVTAGDASFAGTQGGQTVNMIIRAWQGAAGSTYDSATIKGASNPFSVTFGATTVPPSPSDNLANLGTGNITLTPEPTTLALGALGLGALALYRRKKA